MTPDQSNLYNKFHIISVGLRKIEKMIEKNREDNKIHLKIHLILERLITTSDKGMEYIEEADLGWIGG